MITQKDLRIQKLGKKLLKLSNHSRYKMVCLLVKGGNILSVGNNKENSAPKPFVKQYRPSMQLHAEMSCLAGVLKENSKNSTVYVLGETVNGNQMLSKPCPSCESFLKEMLIRRVVYENREGILEEYKL